MNLNLADDDRDLTLALGTPVWYLQPNRTKINLDELGIHIINMRRYLGGIDIRLVDHLAICSDLLAKAPSLNRFLIPTRAHPTAIHTNPVIQMGYAGSHDVHEGITGDVPSGLKKYLKDFKVIEDLWEEHVHGEIKLPLCWRNKPFVKAIDVTALILEMLVMKHPRGEFHMKECLEYLPTEDIEFLMGEANYWIHHRGPKQKWAFVKRTITNAQKELKSYMEALDEQTK